MRRSAVAVAFSVLVLGSTALHAAAEDYYCPPGAKFCPAPGSTQASAQVSAPGGFGLDSSVTSDQFAAHQGLLNEGETLIMVAPSTSADAPAYPASGMMSTMSTMSSPMPMQSQPAPMMAQSYAAAPVSGGMPMDFMPPPPGSARTSAAPSASFGGGSTYAAVPAPAQTYRAEPSYEPARTVSAAPVRQEAVAAAPARRAPRESVKVSGPAARVAPMESARTPSPDSFAQARAASSYDDDDDDMMESSRSRTSVAEKPTKKRRADMLSEVANETSRKSPKSDGKPSKSSKDKEREKDKKSSKKKDAKKEKASEDRVPWWKGGLWRNRNR